jgi:peptidoglycan/LPS O-acetylase OafA/YrhL
MRKLGILIFLIGVFTSDYLINGLGRFLDTYRIIFAASLLFFISNLPPNLMGNLFLKYLGSRSYVIYALHWPELNLLDNFFLKKDLNIFFKLISYLVVVFLVVEIAYRYIEIPAISLSRRLFKYRA